MNWYHSLFFAGVFPIIASTLSAESTELVSLSSVANRVRTENPSLLAARQTIDEAVGKLRQAGRLENPDFESEVEQNNGWNAGRIELGISQKFPLTNRLEIEKNLGTTDVQAAQAEVREMANKLVGEAKAAVIRILVIRERKALFSEQAELLATLADSIATAAEKGEAPALEASQARLGAMSFLAQSRQLGVDEILAIAQLKPLLGIAAGRKIMVSGTLPAAEFPKAAGGGSRPAIEMGKLAVLAAEQATKIEQAKRRGDARVGVYASGAELGNSQREALLGLRFSIPLPFWEKNEGNIAAAAAKVNRRRAELAATRQGIELEAEAALGEMTEWAKLARETEQDLLPQAEAQTVLTEKAWREGQADFAAVLRAREQRLNLSTARLAALENFQLAQARYRTALGNL